MRKIILLVLPFLLTCKILLISGCANIIPPTGGPRDTTAPKLVLVNPQNNSLHFQGNRIVFNFNEFIELKEPRTNITISPVPKMDPLIESKLKTLTIKIRDSLQPNTTYSIDFGKSIQDVNEGNVLKRFSYTFSTGNYLDSTSFSGKVILAATGKSDSTLIAMLYQNMDDSAVIKEKPRYIVHTDSGGHFIFHHLHPGTYALYALKDESGSKKYISKSQLFAFASVPALVGDTAGLPVILYAFADTSTAPGTRIPKKTIKAPIPPPAKTQDKNKRLRVSANVAEEMLDLQDNPLLAFTEPLKKFDSTKIHLTDEKFQPLKNVSYRQDSTLKKITIYFPWKIDTRYAIIAEKEFAEDTLGGKLLRADTISFKTKAEADYGSLRIRFSNLDLSQKPVLQFLQGDLLRFSRPLTSSTFTEKRFIPGDYELRILFDENGNGKWDPGEFFGKHRQPEKVMAIKRKLSVRANWDNEPDYVL